MDHSIVFIIPNSRILSTIKQSLSELGVSHPAFYGSMQSAHELAVGMITQKETKVIISTGLTAQYLQTRVSIPVMEMLFSEAEYLSAIQEAIHYSKHIMIVANGNAAHTINRCIKIYEDTDIHIYDGELFCDRPLDEQTEAFIRKYDFDVIIGASPCVNCCKRHGIPGVLIDIDNKMVEVFLQNARALVQLKKSRQEQDQLVHNLIDGVLEGMLVLNADRSISVINQAAQQIIGISADAALGRNVDEVFRENAIVDLLGSPKKLPRDSRSRCVLLQSKPLLSGTQNTHTLISSATRMRCMSWNSRRKRRLPSKGMSCAGILMTSLESRARSRTQSARPKSLPITTAPSCCSGKLAAARRCLHRASPRHNQAFVAVNCAALPENLLESELFGYVKGAFTGALGTGKPGLFEMADMGTVFLDEISEIPPSMQAQLVARVAGKGDCPHRGRPCSPGERASHIGQQP